MAIDGSSHRGAIAWEGNTQKQSGHERHFCAVYRSLSHTHPSSSNSILILILLSMSARCSKQMFSRTVVMGIGT